MNVAVRCHRMDRELDRAAGGFRGIDTECLFCGEDLANQGGAFYDHVEEDERCAFRWSFWMQRIPEDHGGA
jgi:hypothetical protein